MVNEQEVQNICKLLLTDSKNAVLGLQLLKGQDKETKAAVQEQIQPLLDGFKKKTLRGIGSIWKSIEKQKLNQAEWGALWGTAPLNEGIDKVDLYGINWTVLPSTISHLKDLKLLRIMESKIEELPDEIGELTSLDKLDFSFNPLCKIPAAIGKLKQLKILRLSGNGSYLTNLPDEIGQMEGLEELLVGQNALKNIPATIGNLKNLRVLFINSNELTTLPDEIGNLENLEVLDIGCNNIQKIPSNLQHLTNLKELTLNNQSTTITSFDFLKGLTSLEKLNMDAFVLEVSQLTNLKELEIRDDAIIDIPSEISQLKNLETLKINSKGLENLSADVIKELPNLKLIEAGFMAPISSSIISALEEQFPNITFKS
jgi:Leucine-rich repeat (LRR) protein